MNAGHELDALVAEKVMGWTDCLAIKPKVGNGHPFSPSTEIGAAWEVVEKMRGGWFSFKAWQLAVEGPEQIRAQRGPAVVSFICGAGPCSRHGNPHHNHHGAYDVEAETFPLAICVAALVALKALPQPDAIVK